ncbi:hypothetical protein [Sphingomonas xanthus]|uniref:Uncharacterized protein n=1 Tax=Sphingomonas xanthus TaxID=2594473 RepID=A0A516IQQ4_9SPHN|nr:hypothetical protein [Sphingomonas xanthus]QDP19235.1 hypothetical protein FMM02_04215 [Sphingomonas xanthus]
MRAALFALFLLIAPAPVVAAPAQSLPMPRELSDPAMADRLGRMMGGITRALMDLPVGEIEAAAEGREPTPGDRARRVRDRVGGPGAEQAVAAQAAASGRAIQAVGRTLVASLPTILQALGGVEAEVERAVANIPDPTYPRR